jgi:hypothetical protein
MSGIKHMMRNEASGIANWLGYALLGVIGFVGGLAWALLHG